LDFKLTKKTGELFVSTPHFFPHSFKTIRRVIHTFKELVCKLLGKSEEGNSSLEKEGATTILNEFFQMSGVLLVCKILVSMRYLLVSLLIVSASYSVSFGQWVPTAGPGAGWVNSFATDGNSLYLGTYSGGAFKSTDNGQNWEPIGLTSSIVYALQPTAKYLFAATFGDGVSRSSDNGVHWEQCRNGMSLANFHALALIGTSVFAGSSAGVYRSDDNGDSWTAVTNGFSSDVNCLLVKGTTLFGATLGGGGVYRSTNNGNSWTQINTGLSNLYVRRLTCNGNDLFACTDGGGVFRSTNDGNSWVAVNSGLNATTVLTITAVGENVYAGTSKNIYVSTNRGDSWKASSSGLGGAPDIRAFAVIGNYIFAGSATYGVFRSSDVGATWIVYSDGITNSNVACMLTFGKTLYAGTNAGLFFSSDAGAHWYASYNGIDYPDVQCLIAKGTTLFAGTANTGVYRSTDAGGTWTYCGTGIGKIGISGFAVLGSTLFAGTGTSGLYRSTNNGTSWIASSNGLPDVHIADLCVHDLNLFGESRGALVRSTNGGSSWTSIQEVNGYVSSIVMLGKSVFAVSDNGMYQSTDDGDSWFKIPTGQSSFTNVNLTVIDSMIFDMPQYKGLIASFDTGGTWIDWGQGLPTKTSARTLTKLGSTVFCAAGSHGVWKRSLVSQSGITNNNTSLPRSLALFPNPARRILNIESESEYVRVFDLGGREYHFAVEHKEVDISSLREGLYIIVDRQRDGEEECGWFVKQ
jgi:hypothetical protein